MGLVYGVFLPLLLRKGALISPYDVHTNPALLLDIISTERYDSATINEIIMEKLVKLANNNSIDPTSYDLTCWKVINCGGDFVTVDVMKRFLTAFQTSGLNPQKFSSSYGLAEATCGLVTSIPRGHRDPCTVVRLDKDALVEGECKVIGTETYMPGVGDGLSEQEDSVLLISCGFPAYLTDIAIVDPTSCEECGVGEVGEIWVRSPSVALGYWENPQATQRNFMAKIVGRVLARNEKEKIWLRTGDAGFFHDGQLYMLSRLEDIMYLKGKQYYPALMEANVETSHELLRRGSAVMFCQREVKGNGSDGIAVDEDDKSKKSKKKSGRALDRSPSTKMLGSTPPGMVDALTCDQVTIAIVEIQNRTEYKRYMQEHFGKSKSHLVEMFDAIIACIRKEILNRHGIMLDLIVLIRAHTIPKTTTGKKKRLESRKAYLNNSLEEVIYKSTSDAKRFVKLESFASTPESSPSRRRHSRAQSTVSRARRGLTIELDDDDDDDVSESPARTGGVTFTGSPRGETNVAGEDPAYQAAFEKIVDLILRVNDSSCLPL